MNGIRREKKSITKIPFCMLLYGLRKVFSPLLTLHEDEEEAFSGRFHGDDISPFISKNVQRSVKRMMCRLFFVVLLINNKLSNESNTKKLQLVFLSLFNGRR